MMFHICGIDAYLLQMLKRKVAEPVAADIPDHSYSRAKLCHLGRKDVCGPSQLNCVIAHNFFHLFELGTHIAGDHQIDAHVRDGEDI
jgi:hypothetical protein